MIRDAILFTIWILCATAIFQGLEASGRFSEEWTYDFDKNK